MKVFLKFNEFTDVPQVFDGNYRVISKFYSDKEKFKENHFLLDEIQPNDISFLEKQEEMYQEYIKMLPKDLKEIFISSKASLYFVMMAIHNWVRAIEKLNVQNEVDEIIFTEILFQNFYLPFYEAEAEISSRFYYESYDFVSNYIYRYFDQKIKLAVVKKRSKIPLYKRIFIRRYGLFVLKYGLHTLDLFKSLKNKKENLKPKEFLFLSRGMAHSQYILDFCKKNNFCSSIHVANGIRTKGKNEEFLSNNEYKNYLSYSNLNSFPILIKSFFKTLFLLLKYNLFYRKKIKRLDIALGFPFSSAIVEMIIHYVETDLYIRNLEKLIKKNKGEIKVLITAEIYTQYVYFVSKLAKENNIKSIQLITVGMTTNALPKFNFCDRLAFNQKKVMDLFVLNNKAYAENAVYWGNLSFDESKVNRTMVKKSNALSVICFTQPVNDEENDFLIIETLTALKEIVELNIFIKPHPREKEEKFQKYLGKIEVLESTAKLDQILNSMDIAIVKFSAVENFLINNGIPIIYACFSDIARYANRELLKLNFKGFVFTPEELVNVIKDKNYPKEYEMYLRNQINQRYNDWGIQEFYKQINSFVNE